jgi:hypothetical protein
MNVEIGDEVALFPEKEYISVIFVAVYSDPDCPGALFYLYEDQEFIIPKIYNFSGSEIFYLDVGTVQAS